MGLDVNFQTQVVVVGAGLAGLAVANRVAQDGIDVVVLERGTDEAYLCNSRYTGGLFHIAMDDMAGEPDWVLNNLNTVTRGSTDPELGDALVSNARRTLRWLASLGVRFIQAGPDGLRRHALAPPGVRDTGLNWRGRSGDVMLRTLGASLQRFGGKILRGVAAEELCVKEDKVVGVVARNESGETVRIQADKVVIADGGFQANEELLRRFVCSQPSGLLQRNARTGMGNGLQMAEAIGAKLVGMDMFYGHIQHRRAMTEQELWPYPLLDFLATAGIVVDQRNGKRFCDEGLGGVYVTNAIAKLDDPLSAVIVFDDAIWNGPGRDWLLPANPFLLKAGGDIISAPSLTALAERIGVEASTLEDTVASYNRLIDNGEQGNQPPRTTSPYAAWRISEGPFHAVEVCAGITYTMGGIATDRHGRVLDTKDTPIDGLYAVGACTGGLEGQGGAAGYSGGLSKSSVFGMLAGEHIAEQARSAAH